MIGKCHVSEDLNVILMLKRGTSVSKKKEIGMNNKMYFQFTIAIWYDVILDNSSDRYNCTFLQLGVGSVCWTQKWPLYCPQGSGTLRQQLFMMHGIAWYCMVLNGIAGYCMVLHCIARYFIVLRGISWYFMVLHGIAWYCIVLRSISWYCMVLHGIAWYCVVLHCIT